MSGLSNCCHATVKVDTEDEGTSCYVCEKCGMACDLVKPEDRRE